MTCIVFGLALSLNVACSPSLTKYEKQCIENNEKQYRDIFLDCLGDRITHKYENHCIMVAVHKVCYQNLNDK